MATVDPLRTLPPVNIHGKEIYPRGEEYLKEKIEIIKRSKKKQDDKKKSKNNFTKVQAKRKSRSPMKEL